MFEDFKNNIDFFIRTKTKFSRENFVEKSQKKLMRNYLENLYTYDVLEQYLSKRPKQQLNILDIGCKNWFYANGENAFFKSFCETVNLYGVEIDAYRLYSNFYSRYETAKFYTKKIQNATYLATNLLNVNQKFDYMIWILPFVIRETHKMWGLPEKYFYPEILLKHAYSLLNEDGEMLIINQGLEEAQIQKELLNKLGIKYTEKGIVKSSFFEYKNDRFAFVIKK